MCVHPKLKANCPQFQNIGSLPYLTNMIDLDHLSTKSDISNYVDVQDVKLTTIDNVFNVMLLNAYSLTKKINKLKELGQSLHQKKIEVDAILLCETFLHTEALKLVQIQTLVLYYNNTENTTGRGIAMYVNDKFHHKEQLILDVFFVSKFSEVAINKKFRILLSDIYIFPNTSEKKIWKPLYRKLGLLIH